MVSSKLAAALVVNGREDITSEQMDRLIQMFVLMVKLNKKRLDTEGKELRISDLANELGLPVENEVELNGSDDFEAEMNHTNQNSESITPVQPEPSVNSGANSSMLESLTDADLQTLLQNFKHLSHEEQHHLIVHLKKLENVDPQRVEKLRKYVNVNDETNESVTSNNDEADAMPTRRSSNHVRDESPPGTSRGLRNPYSDEEDIDANIGSRRQAPVAQNINLTQDDEDDDDDYNFEDVFKAASSNVSRGSGESTQKNTTPKDATENNIPSKTTNNPLTFNAAGFNVNLSDTENLIANLMGNLKQSNATKSSTVSAGVPPPLGQNSHPLQPRPAVPTALQRNSQAAIPGVNMQRPQGQQQQSIMTPQQANQPYYQQAQAAAMGTYGGYDQQSYYQQQQQMAAGYGNATVPSATYGGVQQTYGQQWGATPQPWQNYTMPMPNQQAQPQQGYQMYGRPQ